MNTGKVTETRQFSGMFFILFYFLFFAYRSEDGWVLSIVDRRLVGLGLVGLALLGLGLGGGQRLLYR